MQQIADGSTALQYRIKKSYRASEKEEQRPREGGQFREVGEQVVGGLKREGRVRERKRERGRERRAKGERKGVEK